MTRRRLLGRYGRRIVVAISLAGCAAQRKCDANSCADDAAITAQIQAALYANKAIATWDIQVQTINHTVYLYGLVDTNVQRAFIDETAHKTPGVEKVVDSISIRGRF